MKKKALITGISGQDGYYLAKLLLTKDYEVFGMVRNLSVSKNNPILTIANQVTLVEGELGDFNSLRYVLAKTQPHEIYNFGAQSVVTKSWEEPLHTIEVTGMGPARFLEAIRKDSPKSKFFQPSSSEMLGTSTSIDDPLAAEFYPLSPYAASKLLSYHLTRLYRERYDLFCASGVMFNHESPLRDEIFVSRKITKAAVNVHLGRQDKLIMGDIDVVRDWGFAGDYVEAVWKMMQLPKAKDYIISSGEHHTVRDWLQIAFGYFGLDYQQYVVSDTKYMRPMESKKVMGDPSLTFKELDWKPKTSFKGLVEMMVKEDLIRAKAVV